MRATLLGASVPGQRHLQEGRPNEDALLMRAGHFGTLMAVADGLGSKPRAQEGSRAAVKAALEAVKAWGKSPQAGVTELLVLIEAYWRLLIAPSPVSECATTLLLAYLSPQGVLTLCMLGDGLALIDMNGRVIQLTARDPANFSNQTVGLGVPHKLSEWRSQQHQMDGAWTVLLATDGVSEDLDSEVLGDLPAHLVATYGATAPSRRTRRLAAELRQWRTAHHTDDKTLALMWPETL
jgi:serine/threonine protein phosphatase PrpC